jgi:nicotinamidase-related amidase
MSRTAIFIVDIQADLATIEETRMPHAARVISAAKSVLERARARIDMACDKGETPPLELVFVQHHEDPSSGALVKDTDPWKLVLPPREGNKYERLVEKDVRKSRLFCKDVKVFERTYLFCVQLTHSDQTQGWLGRSAELTYQR